MDHGLLKGMADNCALVCSGSGNAQFTDIFEALKFSLKQKNTGSGATKHFTVCGGAVD